MTNEQTLSVGDHIFTYPERPALRVERFSLALARYAFSQDACNSQHSCSNRMCNTCLLNQHACLKKKKKQLWSYLFKADWDLNGNFLSAQVHHTCLKG